MLKSKFKLFVAAAAFAAAALTSCQKVDLSGVEERLDALENGYVTLQPVPGQVSAISSSVTALQGVRDSIRTAVAVLSDSSSSYAARIASLELKVKTLDPGNMADAILDLQARMAQAESLIEELQAADVALEGRIAALEALTESLPTKDWVNATLTTLKAEMATAADLAKVQALLAGLPEGTTVAQAINSASEGVKGWVNDTLSHYWKAGKIQSELAALKSDLEKAIAQQATASEAEISAVNLQIVEIKNSISALQTKLEETKAAIEKDYKDAIASAKTDLDGKITANINDINAANGKIEALQTDVDALKDQVTALAARMTAAEGRLNEHDKVLDSLKSMVQSAVFVPKYTGGDAVATDFSLTLDYEVLPCKAGKAIADLWNADGGDKSILQANYRAVLTRSGLPTLEIEAVEFNASDSLLEVTVNLLDVADILISGDRALAVSLRINTGVTMVSSPFTDIRDAVDMSKFADLSSAQTANCYIVTEDGFYKFDATVKGNSTESVGTPVKAEVLWESFGTGTAPVAGALIKTGSIKDGYVRFISTREKGNAVIAVRDENGKILWSWHIWLAGGQPQGQAYYSSAGTMMDRNLGATSTEKGNPGALGLLYQWGRKDPFLGSYSIDSGTDDSKTAASVMGTGVSWSTVSGPKTPAASAAIPTTFITGSDWTSPKDDALWGSSKTMYDPCPVGWRVPDGGDEGVWYKAFGSGSWTDTANWDSVHKGMDFAVTPQHKLGSGTIWYPAARFRYDSSGALFYVGSDGFYWSCTVYNTNAYLLYFNRNGSVNPSNTNYRANGFAVRCLSESN